MFLQHQLYVKEEKCEFHKTTVSFLNNVISLEEVSMDQAKPTAVLKWVQYCKGFTEISRLCKLL